MFSNPFVYKFARVILLPTTMIWFLVHACIYVFKIKVFVEGFGLTIESWLWLLAALPFELFFFVLLQIVKDDMDEKESKKEYENLVRRISRDVVKYINKK